MPANRSPSRNREINWHSEAIQEAFERAQKSFKKAGITLDFILEHFS